VIEMTVWRLYENQTPPRGRTRVPLAVPFDSQLAVTHVLSVSRSVACF